MGLQGLYLSHLSPHGPAWGVPSLPSGRECREPHGPGQGGRSVSRSCGYRGEAHRGRNSWGRPAEWPRGQPLPSPRSILPCAWEAHVSGGLGVGCTTWAHSGHMLTLSAQHTSLGARRPWFQTQLSISCCGLCESFSVFSASVFSSLKWESYS